jgi:predicted enzyme related to lactoylglutathione lyase
LANQTVGEDMFAVPPYLSLVVIRVKDLAAARRFYESFGFFFETHKHGRGAEHLAGGPVKGSALLEIYPLGEGQIPTTSVRIGFNVDAVDSYIAGLVSAGGNVIQPPHDSDWGRRAVIQDPEGHKVELVTPHHRAQAIGEQDSPSDGDNAPV